jgi:hypothetical protein
MGNGTVQAPGIENAYRNRCLLDNSNYHRNAFPKKNDVSVMEDVPCFIFSKILLETKLKRNELS